MPYDISILSEIIKSNGATSMAICCRCHDEVPSFSWCFTCLSPLCEFHHQDHRLSIDTRSHEVRTFQDISKGNEKRRVISGTRSCFEMSPGIGSDAISISLSVSQAGLYSGEAVTETISTEG